MKSLAKNKTQKSQHLPELWMHKNTPSHFQFRMSLYCEKCSGVEEKESEKRKHFYPCLCGFRYTLQMSDLSLVHRDLTRVWILCCRNLIGRIR